MARGYSNRYRGGKPMEVIIEKSDGERVELESDKVRVAWRNMGSMKAITLMITRNGSMLNWRTNQSN